MKLYATVTSERASKGQGGNDHIHITLNVGEVPTYFVGLWPNGTLVVEHIPTMREVYRQELCDFCGEEMYTMVRAHHHTENGQDVTKGNKQKGEEWCDAHGTERRFCPTDTDEQKYHK